MLVEKFKFSDYKQTGSGLFKHEADASLAVRACSGAIVLTSESKSNSGPLKDAVKLGGKVLYLPDFNPQSESLGTFINSRAAPKDTKYIR